MDENRRPETDRAAAFAATLGLGAWINRCERAGVSAIGALPSPPIPVSDLYAALDGQPAPALDAAYRWALAEGEAARREGRRITWRWEDCSSGDLKYLAAKGRFDEIPSYNPPIVDDPRLFDCMRTDPQRLYMRPWVPAVMVDGFPVEFRFYFGPDRLLAVSSYYPQRPLSPDMIVRDAPLSTWMAITRRLAELVFATDTFPVGCTMDFLLPEMGEPLFLEGGPAFSPTGGAHPCCFSPDNLEGVAYAAQEGALIR